MADYLNTSVSLTVPTNDGCRLSVHIRNDKAQHGPTLVLLHHWGGSPRLFEPFLREPNIASFRSVTFHARGWHPSTDPQPKDHTKYGIPEMASDLSRVIAATATESAPGGFVLIGHSMGGKVAQYFAATCLAAQKQALKGLVLVAPAPLSGLVLPESAREQQAAAYKIASTAEQAIRHVLVARTEPLDETLIQQMIEDAMRGSDEAKGAWPTYGISSDFARLQKNVTVPVLVVRGDKDFEKDFVGRLGEDQGWANVTVDDCGHMVPLEQPRVLAERIEVFVKENKL